MNTFRFICSYNNQRGSYHAKEIEPKTKVVLDTFSAVFSGGAGGARAPPEFGGSEKGQSLISAYRSLAITTNTPEFKKLNTALFLDVI